MTTQDLATTIYKFAPGVMLRHDKVRDAHVLNAPEKLIVLDGPGHAISERLDGKTSVSAIIDQLADLTGLPAAEIGPDIESFIAELAAKGLLKVVAG